MTHTKETTATLLPRDYGIRIATPGGLLFRSPTRQAWGQYLSGARNLTSIMGEYSARQDVSMTSVYQAVLAALRARAGGEPRVGREAITDVVAYRHDILARVHGRGSKQYTVTIHPLRDGHARTACSPCLDQIYNDVKGLRVWCAHAEAFGFALAYDRSRDRGSLLNITGLTASDLERAPKPLFRLGPADVGTVLYNDLVRDEGHASVSASLLDDPRVYTDALREQLARGTGQFAVLVQKEETVPAGASPSERRFYQAARNLVDNVHENLVERGFRFDGYSLVFKGSDHQAIARRYRSGQNVYEVVAGGEHAPVIVHKRLGERVEAWLDSTDQDTTRPLLRGTYESVDDATRRLCDTRVVEPNVKASVHVPQVLARAYLTK